jgi:hypothetical protein
MKNKLFLAIGALLALALAFSACDDGSGIQTVKAVNIPVIAGVSKVDVAELTAPFMSGTPDVNIYVVSWDGIARVSGGGYRLFAQNEGNTAIEELWNFSNSSTYSIKDGLLDFSTNENVDKWSAVFFRNDVSLLGITKTIPFGDVPGRVRFGVQVEDYLSNQSPIVWSEYKDK